MKTKTEYVNLPFKIDKYHKAKVKRNWKFIGLKFTEEEFEYIYVRYIYTTKCDLCPKIFTTKHQRKMDHDHETGKFRNIVCNKCNLKKADVKMSKNNKSGFIGITKKNDLTCKQGYTWQFSAQIDGKQKTIKCSVNYDWLCDFATKWKIDNKYNT